MIKVVNVIITPVKRKVMMGMMTILKTRGKSKTQY